MTFDEAAQAIRGIPEKARSKAKDFVRIELLARGRKLTRSDLAIAVAYLDGLNWKDGYCYHGAKALSRATGCCRRSVMSARKNLSAAGIIATKLVPTNDHVGERLQVTFPHLVQFFALGGAEICTGSGASGCTPLVQAAAPKPLKRTSEDKPSAKASASRQEGEGQPGKEDGFNRFWQAYPRKVAKAAARKAWDRLTAEQRDRAIGALPAFAAKIRRDGTDEKYIPHPATWLNNERFEDFEPTQSDTPAADVDYLRNLAEHYLRTEDWDRALGPAPGSPGSKVSAALLAEIRVSLRKSPNSDAAVFTEASGRVVPFEVPHAKARA